MKGSISAAELTSGLLLLTPVFSFFFLILFILNLYLKQPPLPPHTHTHTSNPLPSRVWAGLRLARKAIRAPTCHYFLLSHRRESLKACSERLMGTFNLWKTRLCESQRKALKCRRRPGAFRFILRLARKQDEEDEAEGGLGFVEVV